jgi:sugar (pentulose or hexulose) kinase
VGVWPDLAATVPLIKPESETLPNPDNKDVYEKLYQKYVKMYGALKWSFED